MTNAEMDAIQVDNPPVFLQAALTPGFKLLGQRLVEATDGTGDFRRLPSGFERLLPRMSRAHPSHEHLRESFSDVWLVTAIALKGLGVELTRAVSGHFNILQPTRRCREISSVGTVAIAFAFGATFSPRCSYEGI